MTKPQKPPVQAGARETASDIRLFLDNIRSVHNVGSIFRTAETLGISRIYCSQTTPTPLDRFGRPRTDLAKVALGAEKVLSWEHIEDDLGLIEELKKQGFTVVALEQAPNSVDYKEVSLPPKALIILGQEVSGVSPKLIEATDIIAEIPLRGQKESLNVSVATGIFLYRLLDR